MKVTKLFGPPGTGKTFELLQIMEREMASGVPPERIAYLSFTRRARAEAMDRAREKFGYVEKDLPYFRTIHSIAFRELGMTGSQMVRGGDDLGVFAELMGLNFSKKYKSSQDADALGFFVGDELGDQLLAFDGYMRHNLIENVKEAYRQWPNQKDFVVKTARWFMNSYTTWKEREGLRDFTDLLEEAGMALPIDVMIVDEAQDLSRLQWTTIDRFAAETERMYIAGDDDQAIFTWAGASADAFLSRPADVERVLSKSYRLPWAVYKYATSISSRITVRREKKFEPRDAEGRIIFTSMFNQVDMTREGSYLILVRNRYFATPIEEHLFDLGVPYEGIGHKPAPGLEWTSAMFTWHSLTKGRRMLTRNVLKMLDAIPGSKGIKRSIKKERPDTLDMTDLKVRFGLTAEGVWYDALTAIPRNHREYLRRVGRRYGSDALTGEPKVRVSTIHGAKGAEADHVVLLTDMSRRTEEQMDRNPDEERRVFYVGASRARETLTVVGTSGPR